MKLGCGPNDKEGGNVVSFDRMGQWIRLKEEVRSSEWDAYSSDCLGQTKLAGKVAGEGKQM